MYTCLRGQGPIISKKAHFVTDILKLNGLIDYSAAIKTLY